MMFVEMIVMYKQTTAQKVKCKRKNDAYHPTPPDKIRRFGRVTDIAGIETLLGIRRLSIVSGRLPVAFPRVQKQFENQLQIDKCKAAGRIGEQALVCVDYVYP